MVFDLDPTREKHDEASEVTKRTTQSNTWSSAAPTGTPPAMTSLHHAFGRYKRTSENRAYSFPATDFSGAGDGFSLAAGLVTVVRGGMPISFALPSAEGWLIVDANSQHLGNSAAVALIDHARSDRINFGLASGSELASNVPDDNPCLIALLDSFARIPSAPDE